MKTITANRRRLAALVFSVVLAMGGLFALSACSGGAPAGDAAGSGAQGAAGSEASSTPEAATAGEEVADAKAPAAEPASGSRSIVVYFSRTGENYGVGTIDEGNTAVVAKMIAEKTGSDTYEIIPAVAYPESYDECCDVALEEKNSGARPALAGELPDLSGYDTVYLGYPIWWGDLPMPVYTFIEGQSWQGKTILPFCTHAGSGLSGTVQALQGVCAGADVRDGLAIEGTTAQGDRAATEAAVDAWMK